MLVRSVLLAISALPTLIIGKPIHDGPLNGSIPEEAASTKRSTTTPGKLRLVENSGVCETTPGVYQASGYGDLNEEDSIWFWFFAARNDPENAPLIMWLNGGPGASSMLGLFQGIGPCFINEGGTGVDLNPMSWNNDSNVLFIDQPVGTGFSNGTTPISTSREAAVDVWNFLQIWFSDQRFKKYASRDFGIWAQSYGGHYGPSFAAYILDRNEAIVSGGAGVHINLKVLGIGNGVTDAISEYHGYIEYARSNPYHRKALATGEDLSWAETQWKIQGGCKDQITACNNGGTDVVCKNAQHHCTLYILLPLSGIWNPYDVRLKKGDKPYPPSLDFYLSTPAVTSKIGANTRWSELKHNVHYNFRATGDWMRTSLPDLERVINADVRTVIYAGDADYIANFKGVEAMVASLKTKYSEIYRHQKFKDFTVHGASAGMYKNAGKFSYLRIFGAGHKAPAYGWKKVPRGAAALQMFTQIMSDEQLQAT